jgi:pimeloyl-ACP methyl ester carboxylesterase
MLAEHLIGDVAITSSACPSASDSIRLDRDLVALMGHSMGATISPLATNLGGFAALILSGAGGSWIENVVHKQSPLQVKAIAELLLEYDGDELHEHDPVLSLLQWAGESADPPAYWQKLSPPHVLMFQGIVDTYILPPIANAASLAFGLSPAEPVLETSVSDLSALMGRTSVSLPSRENAVVQYAEDGIEDGHEIVFQREEPKRQIRCFLETLATGEALIVPGTSESCE